MAYSCSNYRHALCIFLEFTPVFGWLYKTFPMLDLFDFPLCIDCFITGILLLSGIALSAPDAFSRLKLPLVTLGCIAAVVTIFFVQEYR